MKIIKQTIQIVITPKEPCDDYTGTVAKKLHELSDILTKHGINVEIKDETITI